MGGAAWAFHWFEAVAVDECWVGCAAGGSMVRMKFEKVESSEKIEFSEKIQNSKFLTFKNRNLTFQAHFFLNVLPYHTVIAFPLTLNENIISDLQTACLQASPAFAVSQAVPKAASSMVNIAM